MKKYHVMTVVLCCGLFNNASAQDMRNNSSRSLFADQKGARAGDAVTSTALAFYAEFSRSIRPMTNLLPIPYRHLPYLTHPATWHSGHSGFLARRPNLYSVHPTQAIPSYLVCDSTNSTLSPFSLGLSLSLNPLSPSLSS